MTLMHQFVQTLTNRQLLQLTGVVIDELRVRKIARTGNNPVGDYTEWLVAKALGLTSETNSNQGYDAKGPTGERYEIKGRRVTRRNPSLQLGAIRAIDAGHFDHLVAVVYEESFDVLRALVIPREIVKAHSSYRQHTNSYTLHAREGLAKVEGVRDVTDEVAAAHEATGLPE